MCADAVYVRGLCLYYQDNIEKAFQHFRQVLTFAPDHSKAREIYRVNVLQT
jgi:DnaJ homolog subfamily C member 7